MTQMEALHIAPKHALYSIGYALTSAWATVLLFSSSFSPSANEQIVTLSMLSGVVACLGTLLLRFRTSVFHGRSATASVFATGMAAGTLLCTFPSLANNPLVHNIGLIVSGFFAILLILTWFDVFARLEPRAIVLLSGGALLASAATCFAVLALPTEASSVVTAALPIASLACLPHFPERPSDKTGKPALSAIVREAVSWKTLFGVALAFFVIGVIGSLAPQLGLTAELAPVYLAVPAAIAAIFIASAFFAPPRIDASILFKLLLVGVAALAFLLVYYGNTNLSLVFFVFITADVLLWAVLALSSKKTPVDAYAVFAIGWLAECAGDVIGHNLGAAMGNTPLLFAVVMLVILVAVGFAFGDGLFVLDLEGTEPIGSGQEPTASGIEPNDQQGDLAQWHTAPKPEPEHVGDRKAPTQDQLVRAFVERHGISSREADVFSLWVTGHGQKYIQDTLFISESTVKTHLRSIYRKCDTHSRAEIIDLFEQECLEITSGLPQD